MIEIYNALGPYKWYIINSYIITAVTLLALVIWTYTREHKLRKTLEKLEAKGTERQSDQ